VKQKIAILCTLRWGGGAELLRLLITALAKKSSEHPLSLYLLFPKEPIPLRSRIKQFIKKILFYEKFFLKTKQSQEISQKDMINLFQKISNKNVTIITCKNAPNALNRCLLKYKIDIVLPIMPGSDQNFSIPWLGYIFDFQHKYLSHFFSKEEIAQRNSTFASIVEKASAVIVNAKTVKDDCITHLSLQNHEKIFNLPFAPIHQDNWLKPISKLLIEKYKLPNHYFLISNQFWMHKSHITAFKALQILHQEYGQTKIHLVCTGSTHDYRRPDYFNALKQEIEILGLTHYIHILGHIPKKDQICLLQYSMGLIQPTLFEGGPGGGSTYDAIAQGIPAIISDIPVNREITNQQVFFFKTKDHKDLAQKMFNLVRSPLPKISLDTLQKNKENHCCKLGNVLIQAINYAIKNHGPQKTI